MLKRRLIPKLQLKARRLGGTERMVLVTTVQFREVIEIGDPVSQAKIYESQAADELIFVDLDASVQNRAPMVEVVRRAAVLAQRNQPLRLGFAEGELTVSAQTQDVGEARESIPVGYTGDALEIGFNPDFLRDGLESIETDELVLKLISPLRPGLIESPDTGDFVYLIMPIRLNV